MATATDAEPSPRAGSAGVLLRGVSWHEYEAMLRIIGDRRVFVNYDGGTMEVLVPSYAHEFERDHLRLMVDIIGEELEIPMQAGGSTTHRRADLEKGVEPDDCYWLAEKAVRIGTQREIDLTIDPAPSLVIEVNYTSSSIDRLGIYGALGVDEVWRFHRILEFLHRRADGTYRPAEASWNVPVFRRDEAEQHLASARTLGRLAWMKAFRAFARNTLLPRSQP